MIDSPPPVELTSIPRYRNGILPNGRLDTTTTDVPKWNVDEPPPPIGSQITAHNQLGPCLVTGYYTFDGYLGVLAKPLAPPEWYIRKKGYNTTGHFFSPEFTRTAQPITITGPSLDQLEALQHFAEKHGRTWKGKLQKLWAEGRDIEEPNGHLLREIRNQHTTWLHSKQNRVVPRDPATRKAAQA